MADPTHPSHPTAHAIDGSTITYWAVTGNKPWIVIDLGAKYWIHKVRIYQPDTARFGGSDGIKFYTGFYDPEFYLADEKILDASGWQESDYFFAPGRYIWIYSLQTSGEQRIHEIEVAVSPWQAHEVHPAASGDDATRTSTGYDKVGNTFVLVGPDKHGVVRFPSVPIQRWSTILEAYIDFTGAAAGAGNTYTRIRAHDADDSSQIADASDFDSRLAQLTGAYADWTIPTWSNGERGADTRTPDLKSIIQEVVDRAGWDIDQAIQFIFYDNVSTGDDRVAKAVDLHGQPCVATLHIAYKPPDIAAISALNNANKVAITLNDPWVGSGQVAAPPAPIPVAVTPYSPLVTTYNGWRRWFGPVGAEAKISWDDITTLLGSRPPDKLSATCSAGIKQFHGSGWHAGEGRAFFCTRTAPWYLIRVDPDNPSDYEAWESPGGESWADDLVIVGDKVYVVYNAGDSWTHIAEFDATAETLTRTDHNISENKIPYTITSDGTNLYLGCADGVIIKVVPGSWWAADARILSETAYNVHNLRYDSQTSKLYATANKYIFRVGLGSGLPEEEKDDLGAYITDDIALITDYFFCGLEIDDPHVGKIVKVQKTDLSTQVATFICPEHWPCGSIATESDDYIWAVFHAAGEPGIVSRIKVSDMSAQHIWLADTEYGPDEVLLCGDNRTIMVPTWHNDPGKLVTLKNVIPNTAYDRLLKQVGLSSQSYWAPLKWYGNRICDVDALRCYGDGVDNLGAAVVLFGGVATAYTEPTGTLGETGTFLTTGVYPSIDAVVDVIDDWLPGEKKTVPGSGAAAGDIGDFVVLQLLFGSEVSPATTPTEPITLGYENYTHDLTKVATVYSILYEYVSGAATLAGAGDLSCSAGVERPGSATLAGAGDLSAAATRRLGGSATIAGAGNLTCSASVERTGSATLAGVGDLSVSAGIERIGSATLAGIGGLTCSGGLVRPGSATLAGAGDLSCSAGVERIGSAALAGAGNLTCVAAKEAVGAATLAGVGDLSIAATRILGGSATLAGVGGLTCSASVIQAIVYGTATLAGIGSLTCSASITRPGAATLAGIGTLSALGGVERTGSATLAGVGTLSCSATVIQAIVYGTATLAGVANLTCSGGLVRPGAATLAGAGGLSIAAGLIRPGSATLAGVGNLTCSASIEAIGSATLAGVGNLSALATVGAEVYGSATLAGVGSLACSAAKEATGSATLSGVGALTCSGGLTKPGAATLAGIGNVSASGGVIRSGSATLAGIGDCSANATVIRGTSATLAGVGSLTCSATIERTGTATLAGIGDLSCLGTVGAEVYGTATLAGVGDCACSATIEATGAGVLAGIGTLSVSGGVIRPGAATIAGVGNLSASAGVERTGSATLAGVGAFACNASVIRAGSATLAGIGSLTALATVTQAIVTGSATLAGIGGLTCSASVERIGSATLVGIGNLSASATVIQAIVTGSATLAGAGALTCAANVTRAGTVTLAGVGTLSATGSRITSGSATLVGIGDLSASGSATLAGSGTLAGIGDLSALGTVGAEVYGQATLAGAGGLTCSATVEHVGIATLAGVGGCTASSGLVRPGAATLAGVGTVSVSGGVITLGSATLAGVGALSGAGACVRLASATLAGAGDLQAHAIMGLVGAATLAGIGNLSALGTVGGEVYGRATLAGVGNVSVIGKVEKVGSATLAGVGALTADGRAVRRSSATLAGVGDVSAIAISILKGSATLAGIGEASAAAAVAYKGSAALAGVGSLTVRATLPGLIIDIQATIEKYIDIVGGVDVAVETDIEFYQGCDVIIRVTFPDGTDISTWLLKATVRETAIADDVLIEKDSGAIGGVTKQSATVAHVAISDSDTNPLLAWNRRPEPYKYDVKRMDEGEENLGAIGELKLLQPVTR